MLFDHPAAERIERAKAVMHAIGVLRSLQAPAPQVSDDIRQWFPVRTVNALRAHVSRRPPASRSNDDRSEAQRTSETRFPRNRR